MDIFGRCIFPLLFYGALTASACFAPKTHKRFLLFIGGVPMLFLLLPIPILYLNNYDCFGLSVLAVMAVPPLAFLASFGQFFIKGFSGGIAAAAIFLQIMGMFFSFVYLVKLVSFLA